MAENKYQEEGATEIDFVMRNYEYANMAADMGQCRFGFATDLKAVCAKGDSGATVYKFLKDASGSSNTPSTRILFADANGAASSHASLTFDGTTLKIAGALRKAGESVDNLTLGAAGLVTLGGNLALGANYLNYDGTAGRGVRFTSLHQLIIENTDGIALGDAKQMVSIRENTGNGNTGNGAGISLHGNDGVSATKLFGGIKAYKENSIIGDQRSSVYIQTRANGSNPANALRLDSSQNGYIKNKLMVGSLDETPKGQLSIFATEEGYPALNVFNERSVAFCHNVYYDEVGPKYEKAYPASMLELSYDHVYIRTAESGSADSFINWHHALTIARDKIGLNTADPQSALHLDTSAAEDNFIQITNGVTGSRSGDGLHVGVDADGNRVIRTDGQPLNIESDLHVEGDIYSTAMTDYSNSSTVTGLSTVDFKQVYYKKIGKTVFFYYRLSGINNAPAVTFTLPLPRVNTFAAHACKVLVGSTQSAGLCEASDTAYKWTIDKDFSGGGFAGTGETVLINGCGFFETDF